MTHPNPLHAALLLASLLPIAGCASSAETRSFAVENRFVVDVPASTTEVDAWFALPADDDDLQRVSAFAVDVDAPTAAAVETREVRDAVGNRFLHVEARNAAGGSIVVTTTFDLTRTEAVHAADPDQTRPLTPDERRELTAYLEENANVQMTPQVEATAAEVVGDERNPVRQARLLYDWVLDHVTYWVKDPSRMKASAVGSSEYCMDQRCGNCTDFHSLYTALARAAGLPTRMVYGSFFKGPLDGQDRDQSYHCWVEFFAPELGWIPLDVAIADVYVPDFPLNDANAELVALTLADGYDGPDADLVDYYFGNLDARRVTWNRGRDLHLPGAATGPINALPKAHVEFDGEAVAEKSGWTRTLTFVER